ncbi:MAG: hypothetical protein MJB57_12485 [Gemmatimonadetes bacterium]|nr:hypothetical protein [Gemmatimonadota bacterium]
MDRADLVKTGKDGDDKDHLPPLAMPNVAPEDALRGFMAVDPDALRDERAVWVIEEAQDAIERPGDVTGAMDRLSETFGAERVTVRRQPSGLDVLSVRFDTEDAAREAVDDVRDVVKEQGARCRVVAVVLADS